ncbi:hypothetical protein BD410DRAFT_844528 [Rickenella mellea]|uniref:Uncharacterized protein n=1 Tax=Rickenella mellea TaxID=50990 RepID=A0A4Y7PLL1_9AGAM|nr:hypothetical protein BD410DRAFT_844528 [Rickenella mellea]
MADSWNVPPSFGSMMTTRLPPCVEYHGTDVVDPLNHGRYEVWSPNTSFLASYPSLHVPPHAKLFDGSLGRSDFGLFPQVLTEETIHWAFVRRPRPNVVEWMSLMQNWAPSKAHDSNHGSPTAEFKLALLERCKALEERRQKVAVQFINDFPSHFKVPSSVWAPYPSQEDVDGACSPMTWEDAVDEIAKLQRAIKEKAAFLELCWNLKHHDKEILQKEMPHPKVVNEAPALMGGWANRLSQEALNFLLSCGVPCYFIHEYHEGVDFTEGRTAKIDRRQNLEWRGFILQDVQKIITDNEYDRIGRQLNPTGVPYRGGQASHLYAQANPKSKSGSWNHFPNGYSSQRPPFRPRPPSPPPEESDSDADMMVPTQKPLKAVARPSPPAIMGRCKTQIHFFSEGDAYYNDENPPFQLKEIGVGTKRRLENEQEREVWWDREHGYKIFFPDKLKVLDPYSPNGRDEWGRPFPSRFKMPGSFSKSKWIYFTEEPADGYKGLLYGEEPAPDGQVSGRSHARGRGRGGSSGAGGHRGVSSRRYVASSSRASSSRPIGTTSSSHPASSVVSSFRTAASPSSGVSSPTNVASSRSGASSSRHLASSSRASSSRHKAWSSGVSSSRHAASSSTLGMPASQGASSAVAPWGDSSRTWGDNQGGWGDQGGWGEQGSWGDQGGWADGSSGGWTDTWSNDANFAAQTRLGTSTHSQVLVADAPMHQSATPAATTRRRSPSSEVSQRLTSAAESPPRQTRTLLLASTPFGAAHPGNETFLPPNSDILPVETSSRTMMPPAANVVEMCPSPNSDVTMEPPSTESSSDSRTPLPADVASGAAQQPKEESVPSIADVDMEEDGEIFNDGDAPFSPVSRWTPQSQQRRYQHPSYSPSRTHRYRDPIFDDEIAGRPVSSASRWTPQSQQHRYQHPTYPPSAMHLSERPTFNDEIRAISSQSQQHRYQHSAHPPSATQRYERLMYPPPSVPTYAPSTAEPDRLSMAPPHSPPTAPDTSPMRPEHPSYPSSSTVFVPIPYNVPQGGGYVVAPIAYDNTSDALIPPGTPAFAVFPISPYGIASVTPNKTLVRKTERRQRRTGNTIDPYAGITSVVSGAAKKYARAGLFVASKEKRNRNDRRDGRPGGGGDHAT